MSYRTKYNFVNLCGQRKNEINNYRKEQTDIYDDWCNGIKSKYQTYNIFNSKTHTCRQVMYYLKYITTMPQSTHNDNRCRYLYYWIYNDLLKKTKSYDAVSQLYRDFIIIHNSQDDDDQICITYMDQSKDIILKNSAKLTELHVTINNNGTNFNCECAKKCSELYNKYVDECHKDYDYDFCGELENFKNKYESNMVSLGTCEEAPNILPSAIKHDLGVIIIPIIILTIVSFFVFALYKFTPIGSKISRRKRRKNVFLENQSCRTNTLLPSSGRTKKTEENIAYNIAYNSTKYS